MSSSASPFQSLLRTVERAVADHAEVVAIYVYGSVGRDEATGLSDVDLAVLFEEGEGAGARREMAARIGTEVAGAHPDRRFDLRDAEDLPLAVRGRAVVEGRRIGGGTDPRRVEFEVETRRRYFDFLPFERMGTREGLAGLRRKFSRG